MHAPHRFFSEEELQVLLAPEQWRLVAAPTVAEVAPAGDRRHEDWLRRNAHAHAHREVCLMLSGSGLHGCGSAIYPFGPGTLFYFASFAEHDQTPPPYMAEADQLWFSIVREAVIARVVEVRGGGFSFRRGLSELLAGPEVHAGECLREGTEGDGPPALAALRIRGAVMTLVGALVERGRGEVEPQEPEDFQGQVVGAICRHLQETAGRGESLESLARLAGYSKFHFLRLFRQHTGQSVHVYIDQCRLRQARRLRALGHTERSIGEALGFSSPAVFWRWKHRLGERCAEGDGAAG